MARIKQAKEFLQEQIVDIYQLCEYLFTFDLSVVERNEIDRRIKLLIANNRLAIKCLEK